MSSNSIRSILDIALFASIIFASPWLAAIFTCAFAARWRAWEVIAAGILMDFLWMPASVSFLSFHSIPWITLIAIVLIFAFEPLRRQLLLGPQIL